MSTNLYWRHCDSEKQKYLGKDLKYAISPKYWDHDGSLGSDWTVFTADEVPYLRGIADFKGRGHEEARKLVALIERYGSVELALLG